MLKILCAVVLCLLVAPASAERSRARPSPPEVITEAVIPTPAPPPVVVPPPAPAPPVVAPPATGTQISTSGPVTSTTTNEIGNTVSQIRDGAITIFFGILAGFLGIAARYAVPIGAALAQGAQAWLKKKGIELDDAHRDRIQDAITNGLQAASAAVEKDASGKVVFKDKATLINLAVAYAQEHAASDMKALGNDPAAVKAVEALKARAEVALADPKVPVTVAAPAPVESIQTIVDKAVAAAVPGHAS